MRIVGRRPDRSTHKSRSSVPWTFSASPSRRAEHHSRRRLHGSITGFGGSRRTRWLVEIVEERPADDINPALLTVGRQQEFLLQQPRKEFLRQIGGVVGRRTASACERIQRIPASPAKHLQRTLRIGRRSIPRRQHNAPSRRRKRGVRSLGMKRRATGTHTRQYTATVSRKQQRGSLPDIAMGQ